MTLRASRSLLIVYVAVASTFLIASTSVADPTGLDPKALHALAVQVTLDRAGFSPGEIDAALGANTERASRAFQSAKGSAPTEAGEPLVSYEVTAADAAGPFPDTIPEDMMEKSKLESLGYASLLEMLAERFHTSPKLLQRLNPTAKWVSGEMLQVPNVEPFVPPTPAPAPVPGAKPAAAAKKDIAAIMVTVSDATKSLEVRNQAGEMVMYAPVTVGSVHDPLPVGEWKVTGVSIGPSFNYNPDLFWDANVAHSKAKIAPGPNNPVGVVWIDLTKEHYGIHGTPEPSRIGYTQSHGCIRLTNWDAAKLASLVTPGTKVILKS